LSGEAFERCFEKEGYEVEKSPLEQRGFFHALDHGVELEIHEEPIVRAGVKFRFRKGRLISTMRSPGAGYLRAMLRSHITKAR